MLLLTALQLFHPLAAEQLTETSAGGRTLIYDSVIDNSKSISLTRSSQSADASEDPAELQ